MKIQYIAFVWIAFFTFVSSQDIPLPGRQKSAGQQCADHYYPSSGKICKKYGRDSRCVNLACIQPNRGDLALPDRDGGGPALDGTWCGDNKICINKECVNDPDPQAQNVDPHTLEYNGC